jgi:hypothetical protein
MSGPNDWNPEDGPLPTDEELREAAELERELGVALAPHNSSDRSGPATSEGTIALVHAAMRAHATAHPAPKAQVDEAVRKAVDHARGRSGGSLNARRWFVRLTAAAAVLVGGVVGARAVTSRPAGAGALGAAPTAITRSADDVFSSALSNNPGSDPISRIESSRMRSFRSNLFARGGSAR